MDPSEGEHRAANIKREQLMPKTKSGPARYFSSQGARLWSIISHSVLIIEPGFEKRKRFIAICGAPAGKRAFQRISADPFVR